MDQKTKELIENEVGNNDITLLYGHQNYPTKIIDTNIGFIPYLKNLFHYHIHY